MKEFFHNIPTIVKYAEMKEHVTNQNEFKDIAQYGLTRNIFESESQISQIRN